MIFKYNSSITLFLLICICVLSCKDAVVPEVKPQKKKLPTMTRVLSDLVKNGSPENYYHWNLKRAQLWGKQLQAAGSTPSTQLTLQYVTDLLNAGKTTEAITMIEKIIASINLKEEKIPSNYLVIYKMLSIGYLRLAEDQNCVNKGVANACILPIKEEAIHGQARGSEAAIAILERILLSDPSDLDSRWLLNFAHMTLGTYPNKVPKKYLIPIKGYNPKVDFTFKNIAAKAGVDQLGLSGGVSTDDFNNDGLLDIFCTSYGMEDQCKIFYNSGDGTFRDGTPKSGLKGIVGGLNTVHADYDNDGDVDIYILRGAWLKEYGNHPNSLLRNNGDETFTDVSYAAGVASARPTQTATWLDYNLDGNIDLFVGNEGGNQTSFPSELFENNGDATFTEVAKSKGIQLDMYVKGVTSGDINNDGWPDIYVSALTGANKLYINNNGMFQESAAQSGVSEPTFSFPTWMWDVNNDGWEDIFVLGYSPKRLDFLGADYAAELLNIDTEAELPRHYINQGDGTFKEMSQSHKLDKVIYAMGSNFGDINNDGLQDFYAGTGAPGLNTIVPNRLFTNTSNNQFIEETYTSGLGHIQKGHAVSFADFDNDGDLDIYTVLGGAVEGDVYNNALFENPLKYSNFIVIELIGTSSNISAIGARIEVVTKNGNGELKSYYKTVSTGGSFGASSLRQTIGLDKAKSIKEVVITWPNKDRTKNTYENIVLNTRTQLTEGKSEPLVLEHKTFDF